MREITVWLLSAIIVLGSTIALQKGALHNHSDLLNGVESLCVNTPSYTLSTRDQTTTDKSMHGGNECDACLPMIGSIIPVMNASKLARFVDYQAYNSSEAQNYKATPSTILPPSQGPPASA